MNAKAISTLSLPDDTVGEALAAIAADMRQEDRDEIAASSTMTPLEALQAGVEVSDETWIVVDRDWTPIAVFGVAPSGFSGVGVVWMLGTDGIAREWVAIVRQARGFVDKLHDYYPTLTNLIDARNDAAMDWVMRAGFDIIDARPAYGPEKRLFFQFSKTRLSDV